jgi:hypothetical protein
MAAEVVVQLNWVRVYCQYNQTSTEPHNKPYNHECMTNNHGHAPTHAAVPTLHLDVVPFRVCDRVRLRLRTLPHRHVFAPAHHSLLYPGHC